MRILYIITITTLLLTTAIGCSRELTSGDEEPWQPFDFDRIPLVSELPDETQPPVDLSVTETEPVEPDGPVEVLPDEEPEPVEDPELASLLDRGREAMRAKEWDSAIEYFVRALEHDAVNTSALYNLGYAYRQLENWDQAITYAARAVDSDPDRMFVHQNLGNAYLGQGNINGAIVEFEIEFINHPDEPLLAGLSEKLAWLYLNRNLHQEAFDAAIRAVNLEPEVASHYEVLANVYANNEALDQAIEAFRRAVELDPENWRYIVNLADTLWESGQIEEARTRYGEALAIQPELIELIDAERFPREGETESPADPSDPPL